MIERAAILAEGADSESIFAWIVARDGQPEALGPDAVRGGLHGGRLTGRGGINASPPRRYVLPPDVLS